MNPILIGAYWRERLSSPVRMVLAFAIVGLNILTSAFTGSPVPDAFSAVYLTLVLGGGAIGRDVSSGAIHLILVRPVRRSEYVLNRWLAVFLTTSLVVIVQGAIILLLLLAGGRGVPFDMIALNLSEQILIIVGLSAVLIFLSSLVGGNGDVALFVVGFLMGSVISLIGSATQKTWLADIGHEITRFLIPRLELTGGVESLTALAVPLASWGFSVTLCLALAILVLNRREFSYASTG